MYARRFESSLTTKAPIPTNLCVFSSSFGSSSTSSGCVHATLAAALNGILLPFLRARIVEIAAAADRYAEIRLFDAPEHFVVERVLKRLQTFGHRLGVGVLGFQIMDDLRVRFFAQPIVGIDNRFPVAALAMVGDRRNRRLRRSWSLSRQRHERDGSGETWRAEEPRGVQHWNSPKLPLSHPAHPI